MLQATVETPTPGVEGENEDVIQQPIENKTTETPEVLEKTVDGDGNAPEVATPSDDQHEQSGQGTIDKHQQEVNRQHKKFRDEERARLQTQTELDAANRKLEELQSQATPPDVPPMPDTFDDNYDLKVAERDRAIAGRASFDATQAQLKTFQQEQEQQRLLSEQQSFNERLGSFRQRGIEQGVATAELQTAEQNIVDYGIQSEIVDYLIGDTDGPLITQYLSSNPMEIDALRSMTVGNAAVHIATQIKPKLDALKPKPSSAPNPTETLSGNGVPEKELGPKGAKYE